MKPVLMNDPQQGTPPRALGYHEFTASASSDVYALDRAAFLAQVHAAEAAGFENALPVEITFDDGHISQVEIAAPALQEVNLHGLFFVPAAWVGTRASTATAAQLRALIAAGHEIGSHGDTHRLLTACNVQELQRELERSRDALEQMLGVEVRKISAPGGRVDGRVLRAARHAGYETFYTSEPQPANCTWAEQASDTPNVIGRLVVRRGMTPGLIAAYVAGAPDTIANLRAEYVMKDALKRLVGDAFYQLAWRRLFRAPENVQANG